MALLSRGTVAQSTQLIVYLHMLSDVCPRLAVLLNLKPGCGWSKKFNQIFKEIFEHFFLYSNLIFIYRTNFVLLISGVTAGRHHKQRRASNELQIKPQGPREESVGKNLFFTCKANVPNPKLVKDLKWYKANGESIPEDDR